MRDKNHTPLPEGTKVVKFSGKPFKSRQKVNTICGVEERLINHTYVTHYLFEEDDSAVEVWRCKMADSLV